MHGKNDEHPKAFAKRMQKGKDRAFNHRRRFTESDPAKLNDTSQPPPSRTPLTTDPMQPDAPPSPPTKRGVPFQRKAK